jgi:adenylate kinase
MIPEQPTNRKTPNILVTGTPGTGKTTFSQLINQSLNFTYLPIGKLIIDNQLYNDWNKDFDVPEFD